ncbi:PIG-L family deacetylase [Gordonia zhaorongruii]|uniref:PIG-L family deacetylase n=1 Tax=Gordonia zhaorongruii TaxID=2597659 RepID=UPI001F165497|nr:PIG-L family deacetylase [Gordonia zhaorongruii]
MSAIPRALFVHAHPDDESLWTGGTIAAHTARGGDCDLITWTWAAGTPRHTELSEAARALGLPREPIALGYADSFVPESAPGATSLLDAPFDEQVAILVEQVRRLRPDVAVTYDPFGIYGHPDHIHVNRLTCAAADAAALPHYRPDLGAPWQVESLYFITIPTSLLDLLRPHLAERSHLPTAGTPDADLHITVDVTAQMGAKIRAITAHATEMQRSSSMREFSALPYEPQHRFLGWESYLRRDLVPGGVDLF